jgi:hypothetical protein
MSETVSNGDARDIAVSLTSCVTLSKFFNVAVPLSAHLENAAITISTFVKLFGVLNRSMYIKYLE